MHTILKKTHTRSNIDILKARDYYFDKARVKNNFWKKICLMAPIVLSVAGMLGMSVIMLAFEQLADNVFVRFINDYLDIMVGIVAIISFICACFLDGYISEKLSKSNELREWYDCKVLDIEPNTFFYCHKEEDIAEYLRHASEMPDSSKYEVWYREMFSEDNFSNAICLMMDNSIYTYYVYKEYRKLARRKLIEYAIVFLIYILIYIKMADSTVLVNPLILFVAIFDEIKELVATFNVAGDLENDNKQLKDYIVNNAQELKASTDKARILRNIQDVVVSNRAKSLFIPKNIRNKFLDNSCIFYKELDLVKSIFLGTDISKPEKAADFDVPMPVEIETDQEQFVNMSEIHNQLLKMLGDMKAVLDGAGIRFMLDGGTLIGSMRSGNDNRFLAWDDDVDISIESSQVDDAIAELKAKLGDDYVIQDYYSDPFYSPRLSRFRVRQKNELSFIEEKDSELYRKYASRGLFIDVYAYHKILVCKQIDSICRSLFFHRIHKKIKQVETLVITSEEAAKNITDDGIIKTIYGLKAKYYLGKYTRLRKQYLWRSSVYQKCANCDDYYTYEPHYIEDLKHPGPYIPKEYLYGATEKENIFEGVSYAVPSVPEKILEAFYGERWESSPLTPLDVLVVKKEDDYKPILINHYIDYIYKRLWVYPFVYLKNIYKGKQQRKIDFEAYSKTLGFLDKRIDKADKWYAKHAKCERFKAYPPSKIKKSRLGLYFSQEQMKAGEYDFDFNMHMYSDNSFDASCYKHIKSVWIKH